jgi:hypothetical protein
VTRNILKIKYCAYLSTSEHLGQHLKTIRQFWNRPTLANTAEDDHGLFKELFYSWSCVGLRFSQSNRTRSTDQSLPPTLHLHSHIAEFCVCVWCTPHVITCLSNWLFKWNMSHTSITALLLTADDSSTSFSYISNYYCAPQQHSHLHVRRRSNLNCIDKDTVLRCKDWRPHCGHKTYWFILASCRHPARQKVRK